MLVNVVLFTNLQSFLYVGHGVTLVLKYILGGGW